MAPYDAEFTRLRAGDETRKIAWSLYLQVSELTKHGSGRSLGHGQSALFAICAFLASKRLGNNEITRDQACAIACVDPKSFDNTLSSVETILCATSSSTRPNQMNITYHSLLKQFVAREDAYVPMAEVEDALKACGTSVDGSPIDLKSPLMQGAIFYWVCTAILRITVPDATYLRQLINVTQKNWSASQRTLENHCSHMREDLIRKAETALSARTARFQMRTGNKERAQISIMNSLARPGGPPVPLTPSKSVLVHRIKRQAPAEVGSEESGSPSKRPKGLAYVPSGLGQDFLTHTPKVGRVNATASLSTPPQSVVTHEEESDNEASKETIVVRSTRSPRKHLDHSAWDFQKPRTTIGCEPLSPMSSTQDSPSVGVVAFDDTPTTSTGMSSTSSPSSSSPLRAGIRARFHIPSAAKEHSCSIQEGEMPRRQRRNLRAAFLNPGAYGWQPAAYMAKKLERARAWESLMIDKYGDPWDAW